jgi:putative ABC transport system permease protein
LIRVALRSLFHDRGKLVASLLGVAFAATLLLAQFGLYVGFLATSSALVEHAGGDVWVMARGTEVVDNGETLSAGSRSIAASHPCVARVRGIVLAYAVIRKAGGGLDSVQVIGFEPGTEPVMPWAMARGLPQDLAGPNRVAVDEFDVEKLQIRGEPLGASLEVGGQTVYVAALTRGMRSFTLLPYMFMPIDTARQLLGMAAGEASYWVLDLRDPRCAGDVIRAVERHPDLTARTRADFVRATQSYWVSGSGAGTALGFSALLGLVVGVVIVAQTLYAITKEHLRELGTLKAIGATSRELVGFVAWQAAFLAVVGGGGGVALAFGVRAFIAGYGLVVELSPAVLGTGAAAIALMCALASVMSVRKVLSLSAAEVFK